MYPVAEPVTVSVNAEPRSAEVGVYAPEVPTTVVPRFHAYVNVALGDHEPGTAVNADPTRAVPEMVGVGDAAKTP